MQAKRYAIQKTIITMLIIATLISCALPVAYASEPSCNISASTQQKQDESLQQELSVKSPVNNAYIQSESIPQMTQAASAILIEAGTGAVLLESNADSRLPMASTTKTMTALIALERCALSEIVTIPPEACGVEGSSMYLSEGEKLTIEDLLYGLMLSSGNDSAVALAIYIAGSQEGFSAMMNSRAEELGLSNTHFVTPNGLHHDEHFTSAHDLALLGAYALSNPDFLTIVSTKYRRTTTGDRVRTLRNKNSLLWDYEGAVGVKTGYTMAAGRCLLFAAERDGMLLVGAVLRCSPMFDVASAMLSYGFNNYSLCKVMEQGTHVASVSVINGDESILDLVAKGDIIIPVRKGETVKLSLSVNAHAPQYAPIVQGEAMGIVQIYFDGIQIASTQIVANCTIQLRGFDYYLKLLSLLFAG